MGWKSTIDLERSEALELIFKRLSTISNDELGLTLESMGYGDDTDLPYYGYNFSIVNDGEKEE